MPQMTSYRPGTPCWVDVSSEQPERAAEFYAALFGWEANEAMPEESEGSYVMFRKDGNDVAAAGSTPESGAPPHWNAYFATDDAEATAEQVRRAGGAVVMPPFDVYEFGRMGLFQDPQGAFFSVWEAKDMPGATLVDEPGTLSWTELMTTDAAGAARFYGEVFGWRSEENDMGEGYPYHLQKIGDDGVAGIMDIQPDTGPMPPNWGIYFAVDDTDGTVARAEELGGKLAAGPMDSPYGRFAVLEDPLGAAFAVIKLQMPGS